MRRDFKLSLITIFEKTALYRLNSHFPPTIYRFFIGQKTRKIVVRCYCQENKKNTKPPYKNGGFFVQEE
ncbi:hypothetical protein B2M95_07315 [Listeria monocytogenes]|nr:hypothetical protein [Listeria monocytogenes]EAD0460527.1 hypothetical protein [Listeria monocytogenes]EAD6997203.1 hypothetical protein [Listeria monocytogenes]EAD9986438.1 hypothetical protein [Listeria monocytogenes]EAE4847778.1 hypothetical protein [Listeria monocytogenes]